MDPIHAFLLERAEAYNNAAFIEGDPISIPHRFSAKADREISGLFAAIFAWGQRKTAIAKCLSLLEAMDHRPHAFVLGHGQAERKRLADFCHRTFNGTDLLCFLDFLRAHYAGHDSLEAAFALPADRDPGEESMYARLRAFHGRFFALPDIPDRTRKHVSTPASGSACKRLNMYLRWMVRRDGRGVDFGIWRSISPAELICPLDLHAARIARRLGLLTRKQNDWKAALELTRKLREFDPADPVRFDFALFGIGVQEKYSLPLRKNYARI